MNKVLSILTAAFFLVLLYGCSENDFPVPPASTVPKFSVTISNDAFAPATVTFKNESIVPERAGEVTYQWSFGDGTSSTEANPEHFYAMPGAYTVSLVVVAAGSMEIAESTQELVIQDPNADGVPLYFFGGAVRRALLNDQAPVPVTIPSTIANSYGMAVDTVAEKIYIGDNDAQKIYVANLDGSDMAEFRTAVGSLYGMAIDYDANYLYWGTDTDIRRVDLSSATSVPETVVTGQATPTGLAIDADTRKLFWNNYDGGVWVKSLDATGDESKIIDNPLGGGSIIVVDGRLYYDEYTAANDIKIKSTDLSGGDGQIIISGISRLIYSGIAYNPDQGKLYWSDRTPAAIKRANLDGSEVETFHVSGTGYPRSFALGKKIQ
jgi:PKD repeat protein